MVATDAWVAAAVAHEITRDWRGARVDRVTQPGPREICLQLRRPGTSGQLLLAATPPLARVHPLDQRAPSLQPLPAFGQLARRHLEGSRLVGATTPGLERVIELRLEGRDELGNPRILTLVAELCGQLANLVLVTPEGRILDAILRVVGEDPGARTLLPGAAYVPPPRPTGQLDPVAVLADRGWAGLRAALARALPGPERTARRLREVLFGLTPLLADALIAWGEGAADAPPPPTAEADPLLAAIGGLAASILDGRFRPAIGTDARGRPLPLAWPLPQMACTPTTSAGAACASAFGARAAAGREDLWRQRLAAALRTARARVERRIAKQEAERTEADLAERLRAEGELLLCFLHQVPRGASRVVLPTLEDPDRTVTLTLDPAATPVQNAERRLRRYRKAKRAQEAVAARLAASRAELAYLSDQELALAHADGVPALEQLAAELAREGVWSQRRGRRRPGTASAAAPLPPLTFDAGAGWLVLVGRNAGGNDRLTMTLARPQDIWLHARQMPGSHVLLRPADGDGSEPPQAVLLAAARCAAYYSAGRESTRVPVDWTRRRHVWKPAGARPGFVLYSGERTLLVDPRDLPPPLPPS